jgi:hypothetical protein
MQFDKKEQKMILHYKNLLENFLFDEYDILGFLMLIREHIRKVNEKSYVLEFADLIAHRKRDRGWVQDAIKAGMENCYETISGSKRVKEYQGIEYNGWRTEWENLFAELNIKSSKRLLDEITICIFSLANGTRYDDKKGHTGNLVVCFSKNVMALVTTEGKADSFYVCFFKYEISNFEIYDMTIKKKWVSETIRENGIIKLMDDEGNCVLEGKSEK